MINTYNIDKDIIEKAFINNEVNELDKLIHDTYNKYGKTGHDQNFERKILKLVKTYSTKQKKLFTDKIINKHRNECR
jgi:hypothetical protein